MKEQKKYKQFRTSSLQEMNDGGACLESFKFSCVVSKLNVYFRILNVYLENALAKHIITLEGFSLCALKAQYPHHLLSED